MVPTGECHICHCLIPDDVDILITHCPPFGVNDVNVDGDHQGCVDLLKRVNVIKPKIHIHGHIHENYNRREISGITFANVSICKGYQPTNSPTIIEYFK